MSESFSSLDAMPDFRSMSAQDLRQGITTLNAMIRDLEQFQRTAKVKTLAAWREGTPGAKQAQAVFRSSALLMRLADLPQTNDTFAMTMLGRHLLDDAQALRRQYKDVWRARPRKSFLDVAARRSREQARRAGAYRSPKFGR